MPKIQKFETITDWRWLECEITEEQAKEYRDYEEGKIDEPEWLWDLDWDLIKDKPASDEVEYTLLPFDKFFYNTGEHDTYLRTNGTSGVL